MVFKRQAIRTWLAGDPKDAHHQLGMDLSCGPNTPRDCSFSQIVKPLIEINEGLTLA